MILTIFTPFLRWIAKLFAWAATAFRLSVVKYIALKAFLVALITAFVPVAIFKSFGIVLKWVLQMASTKISQSGLDPVWIQFVGLGGFLAYHLMLPQAMAVILTAVLISVVLRIVTLGIV